jgi:hypothetical protein
MQERSVEALTLQTQVSSVNSSRCGPRTWRFRHATVIARLCCGGPDLGGYPRDGFLSLSHGPAYVGHQLFQIVLGGLKLRRRCIHFYLPIRPQGKGLARSIQGQSELFLKALSQGITRRS